MKRATLVRRRAASTLLEISAAALGLVLAGCESSPQTGGGFWRPSYEPPVATEDHSGDDVPAKTSDGPSSPTEVAPDSPSAGPGNDTPPDASVTPVTPSAAGCGLTLNVTTASFGGQYAPQNVGAIWITDAQDHFVKTLRVWADRRIEHLVHWQSDTAGAGVPRSRIDAVTAATLRGHGLRAATWNCTDTAGAVVPNGTYKACFEMTEGNGAGPNDCVSFVKGDQAMTLTPDDVTSLKKRQLVFTP